MGPDQPPAIHEAVMEKLQNPPPAIVRIEKPPQSPLSSLLPRQDRLTVALAFGWEERDIAAPDFHITDVAWYERAKTYRSYEEIEAEVAGKTFSTQLDILAGIAQMAYDRYKPSPFRGEITLEDILAHEKKYNSIKIASVVSELADDLGLKSYAAIHVKPSTNLPRGIVLLQDPSNQEFTIVDGGKVIGTLSDDPERALEQWSRYSGRVHWITELYEPDGATAYVGLNALGERIRPTAIDFVEERQRNHLQIACRNDRISLSFLYHDMGIEAGALKGYGPLDWSPFFRIAIYKKTIEERNSPEYYLDPSYVRGGIGLYYFSQKDQDGKRRDSAALFIELGADYAFKLYETCPVQVVIGFQYMNNWGGYFDMLAHKLRTDSIPSGYLELKLGIRKAFSIGDIHFAVSPYAIGRYARYELQMGTPYLYGIYGIHGGAYVPIGEKSFLLFLSDCQSALEQRESFYQWNVQTVYKNKRFECMGRYEEKKVLDYVMREVSGGAGVYLNAPIHVSLGTSYRIDDEQFSVSLGIRFDDV